MVEISGEVDFFFKKKKKIWPHEILYIRSIILFSLILTYFNIFLFLYFLHILLYQQREKKIITVLYHILKSKKELKVHKRKKCCSHYIRRRKAPLYSIIFFLFLLKNLPIWKSLLSCPSICGVIAPLSNSYYQQ